MATEADPPPAGANRGIVDLQDALDAVVHVGAVIDEEAQAGAIPPERARFVAALLVVIREYLRPLPANARRRRA